MPSGTVCKPLNERGGKCYQFQDQQPFIKHLMHHHRIEHKDFAKANEKKDEMQQQTLQTTFQRHIIHQRQPKSKKDTDKIVELIVLDDQLLQVFENVAYHGLIEHLEHLPGCAYIPETALNYRRL